MKETVTYQGIEPWMLWVAVIAILAICVAIAAVWKVVEINRNEKKRKQEEIAAIARDIAKTEFDKLASEVSTKVMTAMREKLDAIDRKLENDKGRIEEAEKRSEEHDKALSRIERTLDNVDANIKDMHEGFACLMQGTIATLNHQRHNGNAEELDAAANKLNDYITHRPIVQFSGKGA